jgi:hypothetical protein
MHQVAAQPLDALRVAGIHADGVVKGETRVPPSQKPGRHLVLQAASTAGYPSAFTTRITRFYIPGNKSYTYIPHSTESALGNIARLIAVHYA